MKLRPCIRDVCSELVVALYTLGEGFFFPFPSPASRISFYNLLRKKVCCHGIEDGIGDLLACRRERFIFPFFTGFFLHVNSLQMLLTDNIVLRVGQVTVTPPFPPFSDFPFTFGVRGVAAWYFEVSCFVDDGSFLLTMPFFLVNPPIKR